MLSVLIREAVREVKPGAVVRRWSVRILPSSMQSSRARTQCNTTFMILGIASHAASCCRGCRCFLLYRMALCTHIHGYVCIRLLCVYIYIYIYLYLYLFIYLQLYIYMYVYSYIYIYTFCCVYIYVYIYIYIHVYDFVTIYIYVEQVCSWKETWLFA